MGLTGYFKKFPTMNYLANKKIPFGQMERRRIKRAILWLQQKAILAATNRFHKN